MSIHQHTEDYLTKELLRFTTAGSVDDGKSTLIGRLLFDSKAIFQDQLEALERSSRLRGESNVNLALLTDGLRAEREQGITIDVAYRFFSTQKRKYIIADTPGHEQYTRNMVTGASTADLAIVLIDARNGVLTQSKRHGFIASLLGIPHLLVAVNKMDLVDWSKDVFDAIVAEYTVFSEKLNIHDIVFMPVSALHGDNIVERSEHMPWFDGGTVMHHLETVTISADRNLIDFRFPVQYVVRPHQDFRGFAGRVASGVVRKGDDVMVVPSGRVSRIREIVAYGEDLREAIAGQSVVLTLEDEIDVSRGDLIVRQGNVPDEGDRIEATICWMDGSKDLSQTTHYLLQHGTRLVHAYVSKLRYRIDVNTLHREYADHVRLNEIARVEIETAHPIHFDPYDKNRETGSFVLVDPASNLTVAAGMIVRPVHDHEVAGRQDGHSPHVIWEDRNVHLEERETKNGHRAHVVWFTGLSGSGKTTIARELETRLFNEGRQVYLLDGDNVRHGLNGDLGFTEKDRRENIRRIGHVARLMYDAGFIVLCSFISPNRAMRDYVRSLVPKDSFSEVFVKVSLEEAIRRDPKGLYRKAMAGEIQQFTGVSSPYDEPKNAEIVIDTESLGPGPAVDAVLAAMPRRNGRGA